MPGVKISKFRNFDLTNEFARLILVYTQNINFLLLLLQKLRKLILLISMFSYYNSFLRFYRIHILVTWRLTKPHRIFFAGLKGDQWWVTRNYGRIFSKKFPFGYNLMFFTGGGATRPTVKSTSIVIKYTEMEINIYILLKYLFLQ